MFPDERRQVILDLVRSTGAVAIKEIARKVGTSDITVRRDLQILEADGLLDRKHGGAVVNRGLSRETPYLQKAHVAGDEKIAIGRLAASKIADGDAIAIGAGTTTEALAQALVDRNELTVITNSLLVAQVLAVAPGVDVIMTGGSLRGSIYALVGSSAERSLDGVRVAKVLLSGNGLSVERGLSTPNPIVAAMDKALVAAADEVFVLADDSKMGLETMVQTVPTNRIDHLVTNDSAPDHEVSRFRDAGVRVHLAKVAAAKPR